MVPDLRVHFVPHPPNLPAEAAPLPPRPPVRLLFLGYVRGYKGVDMLFEALAELRKRGQDMVLTVAGEFWDDVRDYQRLGERLGISDAVELQPRYVPDGEVSALIASHHIVVAPYRTASQSGVIPIACSAGRSVVVTPVGGLAEGLGTEYPGIAGAATASAIADAVERVVAAGFLVSESAAAGWDDVARVALEAGGFEDSLAGWR
jgi:glycosyltransferase involved in cell wall biosynthesis